MAPHIERGATVTHGDASILSLPTLGLLCSVQCPGSVILQLYDAARALRDAGVPVIGGFQSPMERECLDLLLRGAQPVIVATPGPRKALPAAWRAPIAEGRLLLIAPSEARATRTTAQLAQRRNELVASLSAVMLVAHASPDGKTGALALRELASGKRVLTLDDPANAALVEAGATAVTPANLALAVAEHLRLAAI